MAVKQVKVDVNDLAIGMFVSGLDRPWSQTPFPIQGFYIREPDEVRQLRVHCRHVYVDVVKGRRPLSSAPPARQGGMRRASAFSADFSTEKKEGIDPKALAPLKIRRDLYTEVKPLRKEMRNARQLHQRVQRAIAEVMQQLEKGGRLAIGDTRQVAGGMVDSILRNPDAFAWLSRVREVDEHTYAHSVRSAVWAIIFGRHAGLPRKDLDALALGVLLKDVGKTRIDSRVLAKDQRTLQEQRHYQGFVEESVSILREAGGVEPRVISVVRTHRERLDGSGFPRGLKGDKIPLLGKVAGIVTFYDETTHPRGERFALPPSRAVSKLYDLRNSQFQEELVVEFIRAIGLYPTGTVVELNTGEVGVVVEQNFQRRLKPKLMLLLDRTKRPLRKSLLLDLAEDDRRKQALIDAGKYKPQEVEKIEILHDLEPDRYNLDVAKVRDNYLSVGRSPVREQSKRGWLSFLGMR